MDDYDDKGDDSDSMTELTKRIMKSTQTTMRMIIVITKWRRARMTEKQLKRKERGIRSCSKYK